MLEVPVRVEYTFLARCPHCNSRLKFERIMTPEGDVLLARLQHILTSYIQGTPSEGETKIPVTCSECHKEFQITSFQP